MENNQSYHVALLLQSFFLYDFNEISLFHYSYRVHKDHEHGKSPLFNTFVIEGMYLKYLRREKEKERECVYV